MCRKKNVKKQGVSFIELLVALVIFALTLVGLVNIFGATKTLVSLSQSRMSVGEIGKLVLEPLQMQVRQDQWATNCLGTGTPANCPPTIVKNQNKDYTVTYDVDTNTPLTNITRVKIDVTWQEKP
jgi:prepilin-type N-terminal cleavage/methylation domain-containing protein